MPPQCVQQILDGNVSFQVLAQLGKGGLKEYLKRDAADVAENAPRIWAHLISTLRSSLTTEGHLTATCNVICVFIHGVSSSPMLEVRNLGFSKHLWCQAFNAVLDVSKRGKTKPFFQVLEVLASVLKRSPDQAQAHALIRQSVVSLLAIVIAGTPAQQIKISLIAITCFLKTVLTLQTLAALVEQCVAADLPIYLRRAPLVKNHAAQISYSKFDLFYTALCYAILQPDSCTSATKLICMLCKPANSQNTLDQDPLSASARGIWHLLKSFVIKNPDALEPLADKLFPVLFEQEGGFQACLDGFATHELDASDETYTTQLLIVMRVLLIGCEKRWIDGIDLPLKLQSMVHGTSPNSEPSYIVFDDLFAYPDSRVRNQTLQLLMRTSTSPNPLAFDAVACLKSNLYLTYGDNDAHARSEVLNTTRYLLHRIQRGASTAHRNGDAAASKQQHDFVEWFFLFVESELAPSASYQRHIMALQALTEVLHPSYNLYFSRQHVKNNIPETWTYMIAIRRRSLVDALLGLVLDPFEDVRGTSSTILVAMLQGRPTCLPTEMTIDEMSDLIKDFRRHAEILAAGSNRADHADGLGRFYELEYAIDRQRYRQPLLCETPCSSDGATSYDEGELEHLLQRLENFLSLEEDEFVTVSPDMPLHGLLLGARYCILLLKTQQNAYYADKYDHSNRNASQKRAINVCQRIWTRCRGRLCADSPENSTDAVEGESDVGPKDLLAYTWRALRDSSLLLQAILETVPIQGAAERVFGDRETFPQESLHPPEIAYSSYEIFAVIGDLCKDQLTHLRHRGAFSTVAQTFAMCCALVAERQAEELVWSELRQRWYEAAVQHVHSQSTRLTRRSAGLPAMVSGVLDPNDERGFNNFVKSFQDIAVSTPDQHDQPFHQEVELPQVHAMNCLREIMINSKYRSLSRVHTMTMLQVAANSLSSNIWAIRNCGLMLFRACTLRPDQLRADSDILRPTRGTLEEPFTLLDIILGLLGHRVPGNRGATTQESDDLSNAVEKMNNFNFKSPEKVFAALDLLSTVCFPPDQSNIVENLVLEQLGSSSWTIREQAARIYAENIIRAEPLSKISTLIAQGMATGSENSIHGRLLSARYVLQDFFSSFSEAELKPILAGTVQLLLPMSASLFAANHATSVRSSFLDVLIDLLMYTVTSSSFEDLTMSIVSLIQSMHLNTLVPLQGIVMVRSHPDYLLHRAAIRGMTLVHVGKLMRNPQDYLASGLCDTFLKFHSIDLERSRHVLETVMDLMVETPSFRKNFAALLISALSQELAEDTKTRVLKQVALYLDSALDFDTDLTTQTLIQLRESLDTPLNVGRDLWNAVIYLQGTLTACLLLRDCDTERAGLPNWLRKLKEVSADLIETPTRLSASQALQTYFRLCSSSKSSMVKVPPRHQLEAVLILYDLLNDDDEEVRNVAAQTVSMILPGCRLPLAPLPATERLIRWTIKTFHELPELGLLAFARVIGFNGDIRSFDRGSLAPFYEQLPASVLLRQSCQADRALFVEEKQNLYIDEVRELEIWSAVAADEKILGQVGEFPLGLVERWAFPGLQAVRETLVVTNEASAIPLSPTYKLETLLVCIRVVKAAGLVYLHRNAAAKAAKSTVASLHDISTDVMEELGLLRVSCIEHHAHSRLLISIDLIIRQIAASTSATGD